ncbi:hypothetical protein KN1_19820 [Stygiolobus caldivivus]|uniref:Uncharacterized protein n=1 Tax=Stygiolobus caldivivus TaxID=2824673 RepID=A0A8D5U7X0_9CREN|nr:hypothetical protein KN1_19820 [Stygiolobus caldivivus]
MLTIMTQRLTILCLLVFILLSFTMINVFSYETSCTYSTSFPSIEIKIIILQEYSSKRLNISYNVNNFEIEFNITHNTSRLIEKMPKNLYYFLDQNTNYTEISIPFDSLIPYFSNNTSLSIVAYDLTQNLTIVIQAVQEIPNITQSTTLEPSPTTSVTKPGLILSGVTAFLIVSIISISVFIILRLLKRN